MKQLHFGDYSSAQWEELKQHLQERFWEEAEQRQLEDMRWLLQEQINEEFEEQIGAARYERSATRKDKRTGYRPRSYEFKGGRITGLKIPRTRKIKIRFTVFNQWERVQPEAYEAMLTAYLLGVFYSAKCAYCSRLPRASGG